MKKEKAKRWTVNEGVKALREGDVKARFDIATRFPMFATATLEEIVDEVNLMTVRQVEIRMKKKLLKGYVEEADDDEEEVIKEIKKDEKKVIKEIKNLTEVKEKQKETAKEEIVEEKEIKEIEKKDNSLADDFFDEAPEEEVEEVEEVKTEVVEPEEKTAEPKEEKEDMPGEFDELFNDMED